jgi:PIN domain nuclease of toxin-antitoxin system
MLGLGAKRAIDRAASANELLVSAITPWEIGMLASKRRITLHKDVPEWIREALALPGVQLAPLSPEIAVGSNHLPFEMHPDPADRILVATARHLGATLVTADKSLLALAKRGQFRSLDASR